MASEENIGKLYRLAQEEHGERINYESFRESLMRSISADLDIDEMIIKMLESSEGVSIGTYKNGVFVFSNEVIKTAEKLVIEDAKKKEIYEDENKIDEVTKEIIKETQPKESRLTGFAQMSLEERLDILWRFEDLTSDEVKEVQQERRESMRKFFTDPELSPKQQEEARQMNETMEMILDSGLESYEIFSAVTKELQQSFREDATTEEMKKKYIEFREALRKMLEDNFKALQNPDVPEELKRTIYDRLAVTTTSHIEDIQEIIQEVGYDIDEWMDAVDGIIMTPIHESKGSRLISGDYVRNLTNLATYSAVALEQVKENSVFNIKKGKNNDLPSYEEKKFVETFVDLQQQMLQRDFYKGKFEKNPIEIDGRRFEKKSPIYTDEAVKGFYESIDIRVGVKFEEIKKEFETPSKGKVAKMLEKKRLARMLLEQQPTIEGIGEKPRSNDLTEGEGREMPITDKEVGSILNSNMGQQVHAEQLAVGRSLTRPQIPFNTMYKSPAASLEDAIRKNDFINRDKFPGLSYRPVATNVTRYNPLVVETMVVDTEPLKHIPKGDKAIPEISVPPVVEEVVTEPIEEHYVSKPNMSEANVVPTPPAAEVVEPENVQEEPETALPVNITLGDKLKRGFNALGDKMKAVFAAIVSNDKSKGLFARVSDALAGSAGSSDATSTSSTSSAGQGKEAQVVDYLNQHFDVNVKAARDAAIASQEASTKETKAVDEKGDEIK